MNWLRQLASLARSNPQGRSLWVLLVGTFGLALAARLTCAINTSRLAGVANAGYDEFVYYGAAKLFVHGQMPYRDFSLLHPPGIILAQLPNVAIGHFSGDAAGVLAGRLTALVLSSLTVALVVWLARGFGIGPAALGGLFFATWGPAVRFDFQIRLEVYCNLGLVLAAVLTVRLIGRIRSGQGPGHGPWLIGVLLALTSLTKLIALAPAVMILVFLAIVLGHRALWRPILAALATTVAVLMPFALVAPHSFIRQVVLAQVGRPVAQVSFRGALQSLGTLPMALALVAVLATAGLALVWLLRRIRRRRHAIDPLAVFGLTGLASGAALMLSPTLFQYYMVLVGPPLAIGLAKLAAWFLASIRRHLVATAAAGLAVFGVGALQPMYLGQIRPSDFRQMSSFPLVADLTSVLPSGDGLCLFEPMPKFLIMANRFAAQIDQGCPYVLDPLGVRLIERSGGISPELQRWHSTTTVRLVRKLARRSEYVIGDDSAKSRLTKWLNKRAVKDGRPTLVSQIGHMTVWTWGPAKTR